MRTVRSVMWRRLDLPGMEHFRLLEDRDGWILQGLVVLAHPACPAGVEYSIRTDEDWRTREVVVRCSNGGSERVVAARADGRGSWSHDGKTLEGLAGCVDVDLGFSPSTNTIAIQRLKLAVGASATVTAAWLRFPELTWEPLPQSYMRVGESAYEYRSPGFQRLLDVDELGFVRRYPDYWEAVRGE